MNYGISVLFRAIPLAMALLCFGYGTFIYVLGDDPNRLVAGPVVFSLGMICIALFATAATIIRQIIQYIWTKFSICFACHRLFGCRNYNHWWYCSLYFFWWLPFIRRRACSDLELGLITICVATAATSSTRFSLIPTNAKDTGHNIPQKAFTAGQERILKGIAIMASGVAWIWAFFLLGQSEIHPAYFVVGHVMVGLACIWYQSDCFGSNHCPSGKECIFGYRV